MTSLSPAPVEPLFGRPRDLRPEVTFSKMHVHERFREDRTSGTWSKSGNRQTDGRLQDFVHEATQIDIPTNSEQNICLQTIF